MRFLLKYWLIFVLSFFLIAAFLFLSYLNYQTIRESAHKEIIQSSLPLTRENIYSDILTDLLPPLNISSSMANDAFLRNWVIAGERDADSVVQYLKEIREKYNYFSSFFISDITGTYYHYSGILKKISPEDEHDVWYYSFVDSGREYELDVDTDEASANALTIFFNYRLEDFSGNLLGVTGVGIKMDEFSHFLKESQKKYGRRIFFTDRSGVIQAHSERDLIEKTDLHSLPGIGGIADVLLVEKPKPVDGEYVSGGSRMFVTSRYMPEIDWFLIVEQNENNALRSAQRNLARTLLAGFSISIIIIAAGVLAVRRYQKKMERLAITDDLTDTSNRREFDRQFERALYRFKRYNVPVSLLILDIDNFKQINDGLGHLTGDRVLVNIAGILKDNIRPDDFLARWGGDEFVILLESSIQEAFQTAERLREAVEKSASATVKGAEGGYTISIGLAACLPEDTAETLTSRADRALYQSKDAGKNRATVFKDTA